MVAGSGRAQGLLPGRRRSGRQILAFPLGALWRGTKIPVVYSWIFCLNEMGMAYSELQVTSNFSFLRGASHAHELVERAEAYGYKKIAITDRNTMAGIVRAHVACREK